jgi:hypothetical protein
MIEKFISERCGWIGAVSLLTFDEEQISRHNFENCINMTTEMRSCKALEDTDEMKFKRYLSHCTNMTAKAIINMMNHCPDEECGGVSEKIVVNQIKKSQAMVHQYRERRDARSGAGK